MQVIFYVERSVIFRVCESALYGLLKKCFQQKKFLTLLLFGKIHVCLECSSKWTRNYKQKRFSWFCISEKSKFPIQG